MPTFKLISLHPNTLTHWYAITPGTSPARSTSVARLNVPVCPGSVKLSLKDWLPFDIPKPGDSFCGLDRSLDPQLFSGQRCWRAKPPSTSIDILDDILVLAGMIDREGGTANKAIISHDLWARFSSFNPLSSANRIFYSPYGSIELEQSTDTEPAVIYVLDESTWATTNTPPYQDICYRPIANGRIDYPNSGLSVPASQQANPSPIGRPSSFAAAQAAAAPGINYLATAMHEAVEASLRLFMEPPVPFTCVCGAASVNGLHSTWCDIKN